MDEIKTKLTILFDELNGLQNQISSLKNEHFKVLTEKGLIPEINEITYHSICAKNKVSDALEVFNFEVHNGNY